MLAFNNIDLHHQFLFQKSYTRADPTLHTLPSPLTTVTNLLGQPGLKIPTYLPLHISPTMSDEHDPRSRRPSDRVGRS